MYIEKLKIKNIRCFTDVELDFRRPDGSLAGWTVIAGRNGSGKSTLLRSAALAAVGPNAAFALAPSLADWARAGNDDAWAELRIANGPHSSRLLLELKPGDGLAKVDADRREAQRALVYFICDPVDGDEKDDIDQLIYYLEKETGIEVQPAALKVRPGDSRKKQMEELISRSVVLLAFIGKAIPQKDNLLALKAALKLGVRIIPIWTVPTDQGTVSPLHPLYPLEDLEGVSLSSSGLIERLAWGITGVLPEELLAGATVPIGGNGTSETLITAEKNSLVLVAYGPYRRLTGYASDAQRLMSGPPALARVVTLFREDSSLIESVTWLREVYLQRLETKQGAADLEQAVLRLLNDGLLPDEAQVDGIDSGGLWVVQRGIRLPLEELSDGYRTVAALVIDLVAHLHRHHGQVDLEAGDKGVMVRNPAVVLIDEVDLHLHVSWQKKIGMWLKDHFPAIQFIVTTHSPFVCQAADPGGLYRLPGPGDKWQAERVSDEVYFTVINGTMDEAVLSELFGLESVYSEETEKLREKVAKLEAKVMGDRATPKDLKNLEILRGQLPDSMSSSVEQVLRTFRAAE